MTDIYELYAAMRSGSGGGGGGSSLPDITPSDIGKLLGVQQNGTAGWVNPPENKSNFWCGTYDEFIGIHTHDHDLIYLIVPEFPGSPLPTGTVDAVDGAIEGLGESLVGLSASPSGQLLYGDFDDTVWSINGRLAYSDFAVDTSTAQLHEIDDGTLVCDLFEITNEGLIEIADNGTAYVSMGSSDVTRNCVIYRDSGVCKIALVCDGSVVIPSQSANIEFTIPKAVDNTTYSIKAYSNGANVRAFRLVEKVDEVYRVQLLLNPATGYTTANKTAGEIVDAITNKATVVFDSYVSVTIGSNLLDVRTQIATIAVSENVDSDPTQYRFTLAFFSTNGLTVKDSAFCTSNEYPSFYIGDII